MIASFIRSFKSEKGQASDIPDELIRKIKEDLPSNFTIYHDPETNKLVIGPKPNHTMTLKIEYDFDSDEKYVYLKKIPRDRLLDYLYRSQKSIPVTVIGMGDENKTIPLEKIGSDPFRDNRVVKNTIIYPEPFSESIPVVFESPEGEKVEISFRQQAYDSMTELLFQNIDFPALSIMLYLYDPIIEEDQIEDKNFGKCSITVQPKSASSVEDAITALHIYQGIMNGTAKMNGAFLNPSSKEIDHPSEQLHHVIYFWETIKKIEKKMNVRFIPSTDYSQEDAQLFNELDFSLIRGHKLIWNNPFSHFHANGVRLGFANRMEQILGKEKVGFRFVEGPLKTSFMGAEFDLYSLTILEDMIIERADWDQDKKGAEFYILDNPDQPWKLCRQYITQDEAIALQKEIEQDKALLDGNKKENNSL